MVASSRFARLSLPPFRGPAAPLIAGAAGLVTALLFALMPADLLDSLAVRSGLADAIRVAQPPLGGTARAALALVGGGGVALFAWLALLPVLGARKVTLFGRSAAAADGPPRLRRADAHPDAPARSPVRATRDLGTPFLEVTAAPVIVEAEYTPVPPIDLPPVERDLPGDLDLPLAAFDPAAIPTAPVARPACIAPLSPPPRAATPASAEPIRPASVESLLDRLERSVAARPPVMPRNESIDRTLVALRRLAAGGAG